jgi:hypothetical protein
MYIWPVHLCEEECYETGRPENITRLVNATIHRWKWVNFPMRRCPTILAFGVQEYLDGYYQANVMVMHHQQTTSSSHGHLSLDLTVCKYFLWGCQGKFLPPPPPPPPTKTLPELWRCINNANENVTEDMLQRVRQEWEYCLDICCITWGAHIKCIYGN